MIQMLAIHGYRSLREVVLPLAPVSVVTGENGAGKSSLYRALRLLAATATGGVVTPLARDGGLERVLWAGPEQISGAMRRGEVPVQGSGKRRKPVSLMLGVVTEDLGYLIDIGLPPPAATVFRHDPIIKREEIFAPPLFRPAARLVTRASRRVLVAAGHERRQAMDDLSLRVSVLSELADPQDYPETLAMRRTVASWRFYDSFRTDAEAPARRPCLTTWTPVLADDGHDLASAIASIQESAWAQPFSEAVETAFPGTEVGVEGEGGLLSLAVHQPGMLRPLAANELSDGTLRFLLLAAALLSPQPPRLLVLNEPETSLHPQVLPVLANLITRVSRRTQVLIVSHSEHLIGPLTSTSAPPSTEPMPTLVHHHLVKRLGETMVEGQGVLSTPRWEWGSR